MNHLRAIGRGLREMSRFVLFFLMLAGIVLAFVGAAFLAVALAILIYLFLVKYIGVIATSIVAVMLLILCLAHSLGQE